MEANDPPFDLKVRPLLGSRALRSFLGRFGWYWRAKLYAQTLKWRLRYWLIPPST